MSRASASTPLGLPPIKVGTRLTNFGGLDLTVQGAASGGMSMVAWGPNAARGGEMAAVKLMRPDLLSRRPEAERARLRADFEREAMTWCHVWPNAAIITANALIRLPGWDNLPALVLEYAPQGNLRAVLSRGHQPGSHIPLETAFAWARQIAAALAVIHTPDPDHERPMPLVHCDLKPENVLLDAQGWAKLTDLGLTRAYAATATGVSLTMPVPDTITLAGTPAAPAADERQARIARMRAALIQAGLRPPDPDSAAASAPATVLDTAAAALATRSMRVPPLPTAHAVGSRGQVAGTPQYMAPEQWLGMDAVGPATDVYALGVLLFELFVGVDARPIVPDLDRAFAQQDVFLAWYEAHRQGPHLTLSDPAVAALDAGPLRELRGDAAGADGAVTAREVLEGLERLVAACLAGPMEQRPTAAQVRAHLAALAERAGLAPLDIPEIVPRTPANEAAFWGNLGVTAGNLGQREEKLRLCRRAVEVDPEDPVNWTNLGNAHAELGQTEEALAAYQQAERRLTLEWTGRQPAMLAMLAHNQGNALRNLHRYAEAVAAYQRALALAPDNAHTHANLALAYMNWAAAAAVNRESEQPLPLLRLAREELRRAIAIPPGYAQARQLLAEVEERLRRADAAGG